MKIQPIDVENQMAASAVASVARADPGKSVVFKSRLRRLFDRPFSSVLKIACNDKPPLAEPPLPSARDEFDPSSVCLANMVQSYMEETNDRPFRGRHRCNCFNPNSNDSSDDEFDASSSDATSEAIDILKNLVSCTTVAERNLLADTATIIERSKNQNGQKSDLRKAIAIELLSLGHDSSICKSKWEKSPSYPAGEHEYIDALMEGERMIIDIDFRSEFEIARSTSSYKSLLQSLPVIFVGKAERLEQIVAMVSEAAKMSLKKKGLYCPPWRKAEYMRAKWLSPFSRTSNFDLIANRDHHKAELDLIFGDPKADVSAPWHPPQCTAAAAPRTKAVVTGLASLLREKS